MGAKIRLNGKEVTINGDFDFANKYIAKKGAKKVGVSKPNETKKEIKELFADPITPILIIIGVGSWAYYQITQNLAKELKEEYSDLK